MKITVKIRQSPSSNSIVSACIQGPLGLSRSVNPCSLSLNGAKRELTGVLLNEGCVALGSWQDQGNNCWIRTFSYREASVENDQDYFGNG